KDTGEARWIESRLVPSQTSAKPPRSSRRQLMTLPVVGQHHAPNKLALLSPSSGSPVWFSYFTRRTSTALSCAFREHRKSTRLPLSFYLFCRSNSFTI